MQYVFVKRRHLFVVCATLANTSLSVSAEFLIRMAQLRRDYFGIVSEERVRNSFTLVHEFLDGVPDFDVVEAEADGLRPLMISDVIPVPASETLLGSICRADSGERMK